MFVNSLSIVCRCSGVRTRTTLLFQLNALPDVLQHLLNRVVLKVSVAGYASESSQLRKSLLICCGAVSPGITSWLGSLTSKAVIYVDLQGIWSVCTMATSCLRRLYFFSTLCVFAVSSGLKARNMYLKAMVMSCYIARYSKLSNIFQDVQIFSYSKLFLTSTGELWRSSHIAFLHGGSTKRWGWAEMDGTGRVVTTKQMQI